jgi:hypothetical protein
MKFQFLHYSYERAVKQTPAWSGLLNIEGDTSM